MAQCVRDLLSEPEDLSLDPSIYEKSHTWPLLFDFFWKTDYPAQIGNPWCTSAQNPARPSLVNQ